MIEENYNGVLYRLVKKETGEPVSIGDTILNFRDEPDKIKNASCPKKESSTGHVNGYYAQVYDLKWIVGG